MILFGLLLRPFLKWHAVLVIWLELTGFVIIWFLTTLCSLPPPHPRLLAELCALDGFDFSVERLCYPFDGMDKSHFSVFSPIAYSLSFSLCTTLRSSIMQKQRPCMLSGDNSHALWLAICPLLAWFQSHLFVFGKTKLNNNMKVCSLHYHPQQQPARV